MQRGDVYDVDVPDVGRRPAVIVTRNTLIGLQPSLAFARITTRVRGLRTEVPVGRTEGLDHDSVVNCGDLFTIDKRRIVRPRGSLGPAAMAHLREALAIALELD